MGEEIAFIAERVKELQADREHGASWLARAAAVALRDLAMAEGVAADRLVDQLRVAGRMLAGARPSMAALVATVSQVLAPLTRADLHDTRAIVAAVRQEADIVLASWEEAATKIAEHARPLLQGRLLTHSSSATVLRVLQSCREQLEQVIVTEARPGYEGRATAARLAGMGIPVTLITDAQAGIFLPGCSALVLGADSILGSGAVINKVGSALFARAARASRVPCYVLSETFKIGPGARCAGAQLEEMAPDEVLAEPPPGVTPRNIYFDCLPGSLVTCIITERGPLSRSTIASQSRLVRQRARKLGLIAAT
jgi:ribose 1,5-bisphosphate isomerase